MNYDMYEKGLGIRKKVLGAEYVEKSLSQADDFSRPMQQLVTQYCWGEVWGLGAWAIVVSSAAVVPLRKPPRGPEAPWRFGFNARRAGPGLRPRSRE